MKNLFLLIIPIFLLCSCAQEEKKTKFIIPSGNKILNKKFPLETLVTYDGEIINIFESNDNIYLINFWFRGCSPCIAEIPALNKLKNEYLDYNIEFLSVSFDDLEDLNEITKEHPFDFTHCYMERDTIHKYNLTRGFPTTLILDEEGIVRFKKSGGYSDEESAMEVFYKFSDELDKLQPVKK